ncbi:MAG: helix-turn-helix domain-containing protein [Clostridia bacterium]|nr:helix-turn-helix domain-containing protein [Clostridia bacterium]
MSKPTTTIADRYAAVQAYKSGEMKKWRICAQYHIGVRTLDLLVSRYEAYGVEGLKDTTVRKYSDEYILSAIMEYESKGLSLKEISAKYLVSIPTMERWLKQYEKYKSGDKFAFNGGRIYTKAVGSQIYKPERPMQETEERKQRRDALSKLTKRELYELLLDKEAELELIKKAEALVEERESRLRAIGRKSSKD